MALSPAQYFAPPDRGLIPGLSALPPDPQPRLGTSKSAGALSRLSPPSASLGHRTGLHGTSGLLATASASSVASRHPRADPQPPIQDWRRMLEEAKKEIREIRAVEAQMKFKMQREEKRGRALEEKDTEEDIRLWRLAQDEEMKAETAKRKEEQRLGDLEDSKEFQAFKREIKAMDKDAEQQYIADMYAQDRDSAAWRQELARVMRDRDKEMAAIRTENVYHIKEVKQQALIEE